MGSDICVRHRIVNTIGNDRDCLLTHSKLFDELVFHLLGVDKDVIGDPILDFQGEAIQQRVVRVALAGVDIVRGQRDFFTQEAVINHEDSSIKEGEFVIP